MKKKIIIILYTRIYFFLAITTIIPTDPSVRKIKEVSYHNNIFIFIKKFGIEKY